MLKALDKSAKIDFLHSGFFTALSELLIISAMNEEKKKAGKKTSKIYFTCFDKIALDIISFDKLGNFRGLVDINETTTPNKYELVKINSDLIECLYMQGKPQNIERLTELQSNYLDNGHGEIINPKPLKMPF